jgi:hypothetical protein
MVAAYRDLALAEYLSNLLRKPVDADYKKLGKHLDQWRPTGARQ